MTTTPAHLIDQPAGPGAITRAWLPWALGRIDTIATLDDPDLAAATETAAAVARTLVQAISAWHMVAPTVAPQPMPDGAGGICIVWREHGFDLDLDIGPDGRITGWLHRGADTAEVMWGDESDVYHSTEPGCDSCGTCMAHDGCADPDNPIDLGRGDCESCGACGDCIRDCDTRRATDHHARIASGETT